MRSRKLLIVATSAIAVCVASAAVWAQESESSPAPAQPSAKASPEPEIGPESLNTPEEAAVKVSKKERKVLGCLTKMLWKNRLPEGGFAQVEKWLTALREVNPEGELATEKVLSECKKAKTKKYTYDDIKALLKESAIQSTTALTFLQDMTDPTILSCKGGRLTAQAGLLFGVSAGLSAMLCRQTDGKIILYPGGQVGAHAFILGASVGAYPIRERDLPNRAVSKKRGYREPGVITYELKAAPGFGWDSGGVDLLLVGERSDMDPSYKSDLLLSPAVGLLWTGIYHEVGAGVRSVRVGIDFKHLKTSVLSIR